MPRKMADALRAAGWIKDDSYCWNHPDGGKFYPYNLRRHYSGNSYEMPAEWMRWYDVGEVPPSDYDI